MYNRIVRYLAAQSISWQPGDFEVQDDGGGPYIRRWSVHLGEQPTLNDLASMPDTPLPHVPAQITRVQMLLALQALGWIQPGEFAAWLDRQVLPDALLGMIASLGEGPESIIARILIHNATTFEREHPMMEAFRVAFGKSDEDLDALFSLGDRL